MSISLFMIELNVGNWPRARNWYRDVLGLEELMADEVHGFALFAAGGCRLALKSGIAKPGAFTPVFEVTNLDKELTGLSTKGVIAAGPPKLSAEGYRRVHLADSEGNVLTLFEWVKPGHSMTDE